MTIQAERFFDTYAAALLARDERKMGELYNVPALILFPETAIAVTERAQTEQFFAASWKQYEGVDEVDRKLAIIAEAPGSLWVDVTWSFHGKPQERFCYQLAGTGDDLRIAVLTPLELT